ncbi:MAG TPA: AMP-binding protein, partial [Thermoanaerobaculia bacterium]|nr:AMP-binding protein [Thermoanaerobaculia bacterium]
MATTACTTHASLLEPLRRRAAETPARTVFTFLDGTGAEAEALTWGELDERARAVAAALQELGAAGGPVLLLQPPGLEFVTSFLGCLYAGAIAVPAYPPGRNRPVARLRSIAGDCGARVVLAPASLAAGAVDLAARAPELAGAAWIATDELDPALAAAWREHEPAAAEPAFLQYTSGST